MQNFLSYEMILHFNVFRLSVKNKVFDNLDVTLIVTH
jgi:hypothetical protein